MVRIALLGVLVLVVLAGRTVAEEKAVAYTLHMPGYFESNKSGLKGDASFLVLKEQSAFDKVFGSLFVPGGKAKLLAKDAFEKNLVMATIKRGKMIHTYEVTKVSVDDGILRIAYKSKAGAPSTANFASPLILAVAKGEYKTVEFVENGKLAHAEELKK